MKKSSDRRNHFIRRNKVKQYQEARSSQRKEIYKLIDIRHPEQHQMIELIKINYWWSGIKNNVKNYI